MDQRKGLVSSLQSLRFENATRMYYLACMVSQVHGRGVLVTLNLRLTMERMNSE